VACSKPSPAPGRSPDAPARHRRRRPAPRGGARLALAAASLLALALVPAAAPAAPPTARTTLPATEARSGGPQAPCRLALALGLDVSASVDETEYRLQIAGLAAALSSAPVRGALLAMPDLPVWLAIYEWSGTGAQRLLLGWTKISTPAALDGAIARLVTTERIRMEDSTALGEALLHGGALLASGPQCFRSVLDISGDGTNNDGPDPDMLEGEPLLAGVTVNALVIGADSPEADRRQAQIGELSSYFNAYVIRGPDAFVQVALGFADYERAMTRKLLREVQSVVVGAHRP